MKINVHYDDQHGYVDPSLLERLTALCQTAAEFLRVGHGEISVTFVNDREIRDLNHRFRHQNASTDVLSFPMYSREELSIGEEGILPEAPGPGSLLWGDIIISVPTARLQAQQYGHSFAREMGFLLVHGFLHILGYDHHDETSEQEMFHLQEKILDQHQLSR